MKIAVRPFYLVEWKQHPAADRLFGQAFALGFRSVAPHDAIGLRQARGFLNPFFKWCGHLVSGMRARGTLLG